MKANLQILCIQKIRSAKNYDSYRFAFVSFNHSLSLLASLPLFSSLFLFSSLLVYLSFSSISLLISISLRIYLSSHLSLFSSLSFSSRVFLLISRHLSQSLIIVCCFVLETIRTGTMRVIHIPVKTEETQILRIKFVLVLSLSFSSQ